MDNSIIFNSPELEKRSTLSSSSPNFQRSSILTPCRRVGLPRKSDFSVPFSPVCALNDVPLTSNDETFRFLELHTVVDDDVKKCDEIDTTGSSACKHSRNLEEKADPKDCPVNSKKFKLMTSSYKNLAVTAFGNFPKVNNECDSDVKSCSFGTNEGEGPEHNENFLINPQNTDKYFDDITFVQQGISMEFTINIMQNKLDDVENMIRKKENILSDLEQKYKNKQWLTAELREETGRWLAGGRAAAGELLARHKDADGSVTMARLLGGLGVPPRLLRYDPELDEFQ
ncbi:uncharacterized protein LOC134536574 [Bacillus rossius redtenbacheri]|uniref:uncharacterized protein LOC134536574 n=1 Tax=Bacillus rossius redtenbacheri TaxID=93214 RepID=UPI002FDED5D1